MIVVPTMPPSARRILESVASAHGMTIEVLVGPDTRKAVSRARWEAMARLRDEVRVGGLPPSLPQIGTWFRRDHTTVLHGLMRHAELEAARRNGAMAQAWGMRAQLAADHAERCGL